jgi:WASH complex subunit CCDC53
VSTIAHRDPQSLPLADNNADEPHVANDAEVSGSRAPEPVPEAPQDPGLARFFKMVQFGVPPPAVKLKMAAEGYDPSLLEYVET